MDHLPTPFHSHPDDRTASNVRPPIISRYHRHHMRNLVGCSVIPRRLYISNVMRVMLAASTAGHTRNTHIAPSAAVIRHSPQANPNQYIKSCSIVLPPLVCQYGAPRHAPRSNCETPDRLFQSGCTSTNHESQPTRDTTSRCGLWRGAQCACLVSILRSLT